MKKKKVYAMTVWQGNEDTEFILEFDGYDFEWHLNDDMDTVILDLSLCNQYGNWFLIDDLTGWAVNPVAFKTRKALIEWAENAPERVKACFRSYRFGSYENNREYNRMREKFMEAKDEYDRGRA